MTKPYCKTVSKELQYGYSKGKDPRLCVKSFSSCFWDTGRGSSSSGCSPSQLWSMRRTGSVPLRVQKGSSGDSDELFCVLQALNCLQK